MKFSFIALHYNQYTELVDKLIPSIELGIKSHFDYEIIIVDANSSQWDLIKTIASDVIKVIQAPISKNQSLSRNMGTDIATGDYIWHIDGDDWYSISGLRAACTFISKNPNYDLYPARVFKSLTRGTSLFYEVQMDAPREYLSIGGTMQYCVSRQFLLTSAIRWDEETYFWDSEDVWFWGLVRGFATSILPISIDSHIVFHNLLAGTNSDRDKWEKNHHRAYLYNMLIEIYNKVPSIDVKYIAYDMAIRKEYQYKVVVDYHTLPTRLQKKIDNLFPPFPTEDIDLERNRNRKLSDRFI